MDPIQSFYCKLRSLASTLDCETARLQRALDGEESDFDDYPVGILHDLHSEVQTLKDDVNILLDKARLESQENIGFIKAAKILMKKNSADIIKIREFFQKYGYNPRVKESSVCEQELTNSTQEMAKCENFEKPDVKDDMFDPSVPSSSVSKKIPRSPQLSDFGLERYMISQVLPNPPQVVNNHKEEPEIQTPPTSQSLVKILKTPKCALKMDDFECITLNVEHFGISEHTFSTLLKVEIFCLFSNLHFHEHFVCLLDVECTNSPLAPTFCTPGLKIPSTKNSTAVVSTNYPLPKINNSSNDVEVEDYTPLVLKSDECFENFMDPFSPTISSYENLLRTPTPPEITAIPEDILQILSKYNSNLATPVAVKAVPPRRGFLKYKRQNTQDAGDKENW
uniref:Spindle and kinetochore associated complex subunit 3 n=1 Tax=Marmota marmota marmota TaxID=9994 RepID=A0A8C5Z7T9_MARMA